MPPTSEERLRLIIEAEVTKALANVATFEKALTHMAGGVDKVNSKASETEQLGGAFGKLGASAVATLNPINALKGALPMLAFGSIATGVFKTAAAFESAREQFGILLQDAEAGDKVFESLLDFNAKTNFTQLGLNEFGVQLINAKVSTEDLIPTLTKLGDLAKGNQTKMTTMVEVFGRISMKGKADLENLNRVMEAGVPIMDTLAEVMGVSGTKIYDMVSKSQVGADAFKAAIEKLTGAGGQYNGMMAKMAENTEGKFSTAMGNLEILAGTAGESLDGMTKNGLDGFIDLTEGAIEFMKAVDPLVGPIGELAGMLGGGAFKAAGEVFAIMADGLYSLSGETLKTRASIKALDDAVAGTNATWDENIQVFRTLSEKQGRTVEETDAMRTAYVNLKALLPGVTDETLKYALATGRVAEAMKLQEMASTLTRLGQQAQVLGVRSTTATNTLVSGLLAARENLKRAGATPLPYSLDFEVSSAEIGKLDKAVMSRLRMEGGKSFISIGDLGYLDEATKKTVVLRKAEEMAAAETKAGMKLLAESHRDLAGDIAAEQKALTEKANLEKRLAGDTKALYEGIKSNPTFVAPLADVEPTSLEKWTAAWEDYSKAFDAAERSGANLSLNPEELTTKLNGVREAFVRAVSGLSGLDGQQVGLIQSINAAIGEVPETAEPAAESIAEIAESLEKVKQSLDSGMSRFGDFGKLAAAAMKAIVPEGQLRATDDFLKKYGEGFGALYESIAGTASMAFETISEDQVSALEEQIAQLEAQKAAYKESSDNEIAILEAKGESTVDARIRQANEEEKLQASIDRKKAALARKQFEAEKQAKLAQIAMATALGVANTASAGVWAIPLAGGITALGILQAGIVNNQQYPAAYDGAFLPGSSSGSLLRAGERNQPEIVLPLREEKLREFGIGGGSGMSVGQMNFYITADDPRESALAVRTELEKLGRTGR